MRRTCFVLACLTGTSHSRRVGMAAKQAHRNADAGQSSLKAWDDIASFLAEDDPTSSWGIERSSDPPLKLSRTNQTSTPPVEVGQAGHTQRAGSVVRSVRGLALFLLSLNPAAAFHPLRLGLPLPPKTRRDALVFPASGLLPRGDQRQPRRNAPIMLNKGHRDMVYPKGVYDPQAAQEFFSKRPWEVLARTLSLGLQSAGFGLALLIDASAGKLQSSAEERAADLSKLLVKLGPTFIKAGQSASIRSDLLPPAYIRGLTELQDQVPPFPSDQARAIMAEELGGKIPFATMSDEPIAAASLGQVYRGTLPNGTEVAIKVQRPNMERQIALDMYIIRDLAAPLASAIGLPGDLVGTADAWGEGFVNELNYLEEAANAALFNEDVTTSPLNGRVFAPQVVEEASSRRVLTTVWVDGERLDGCSVPSDVPRLCSVAMNMYLEMMLDTGVLHCDPHPGNLLRTADGRLCILDWGLVTRLRKDLQLTLIEHVAHLTARDYAKVPSDLVKLGFVPEGAEDVVIQNGVVDFLTNTYSTWTSGGGASKLDVPKLFDEVRKLASDTDDGLFQVPPYFAYIAKSFSVLEGIGLTIDPNYSIVDETLPYISRRIITDPSPRTAGALETFIFGDTKGDLDSRVLSAERVQRLVNGAKRYAASTLPQDEAAPLLAVAESHSPTSTSSAMSDSRQDVVEDSAGSRLAFTLGGFDIDAASDAIFDLLLSKDPLPLQDIALEQLALIIGATLRGTLADLREASGTSVVSGRSNLATLLDPLGLFAGSPLVETDERDQEVLAASSKLASIASELLGDERRQASNLAADPSLLGAAPPVSADDRQQLVTLLSRKLWDRREELQIVLRRLAAKLVDQTTQRILAKQME